MERNRRITSQTDRSGRRRSGFDEAAGAGPAIRGLPGDTGSRGRPQKVRLYYSGEPRMNIFIGSMLNRGFREDFGADIPIDVVERSLESHREMPWEACGWRQPAPVAGQSDGR